MESLPCPLCRGALEPTKRRHGLVGVCRACRAGAVTLPILSAVAPRRFVNQLWQAALYNGRASRVVCPACRQPFTEFKGASITVTSQLKVCVRCFWVWLRPGALPSLAAIDSLPPAFGHAHACIQGAVREKSATAVEARQVLSALTAGVLRRVF
jgi:Zn-finger nucleic acid-binding protein